MFLRAAVEALAVRRLEGPVPLSAVRSEPAPLIRVEVRTELDSLATASLSLVLALGALALRVVLGIPRCSASTFRLTLWITPASTLGVFLPKGCEAGTLLLFIWIVLVLRVGKLHRLRAQVHP